MMRREHDGSAFLEVRDVAVGWEDDVPLVTDVSFDVARGEIFAILGVSGSGKTTLLRCLIGLLEPLRGSVTGEGAPQLGAERPNFGVSFQGGALLGSMTLGENMALPLRRWANLSSRAAAAVVRSTLALVGLADAEDKLPAELSGGMLKRASIARALVLEPKVVFMDEPSAGLDPVTAAGIDSLISTLRRVLGLTVVLVTHELASIYAIVDRCVLLGGREERGTTTILAEGRPQDIARHPDPRVHEFFRRKGAGE